MNNIRYLEVEEREKERDFIAVLISIIIIVLINFIPLLLTYFKLLLLKNTDKYIYLYLNNLFI